MKKLRQALIKEGRVKELADDLKTMSDADFMKKYGKAKAAIRKDMTKLDEAALTPDQTAKLAPYLQKDADGSQYYNLPTTNPGETGATMGQTNISPAALAQIKSPQGQQGIINQLLAMTSKQNAVPKTTTTATNVSKQYAGGLEEARSDYTPDEMADMLSGKRSQKQIDADAERTRGPNKAPPTKESKQSRARRLNEKLSTIDTLSRPAAGASSSDRAIDDPDIMGSLKSASTPKFDRLGKTGGEPELDFRAGLSNDETEIETDPRLAAEPNKYMQSWGGKFATQGAGGEDSRFTAPAGWRYVEKDEDPARYGSATAAATSGGGLPNLKYDPQSRSVKPADALALDQSPKSKYKFDRITQRQMPADGAGANPNIDNATRDRARAWAAQQNAPGAALAGAMRSSGNPVDTAKNKTDWKTIYNLNKSMIGDNPNSIKPGMKLKMPDGSTYRVQPGDNLSKIAGNQINEQSAMPPDQAARLAPYLQKGADGSQYYNLPTTNPGETGAVMGQTNISPAALAQIKSPQGQQRIIQQLLAMTEPKNAVPKTTTTSTDVSGQYSGGLEELSTNQLARYKTAAAKDAKQADQEGDFERGNKRFHGMVQATKKQFDNDAKKVDENRAARRALMARIVNGR
jgi:LysM repeat protein